MDSNRNLIRNNINLKNGYLIYLFNFENIKIPFSSFYRIILPINLYLNNFDLMNLYYYVKIYKIDKKNIEKITETLKTFISFKLYYILNHFYNFLYFYLFIINILYFFLMIKLNKEYLALWGFPLGVIFYFIFFILRKIIFYFYIKKLRNNIIKANNYLKEVNNNLKNIKIKIGKNFAYIEIIWIFNIKNKFKINKTVEYIKYGNINYYNLNINEENNLVEL